MTKKKIIRYGLSYNDYNNKWEVRAVCGYSVNDWYLVFDSWKYERASNFQKRNNNLLLSKDQYFCLYSNKELESATEEETPTIITIEKSA